MVESTCFQHTSSHPDKYNNSVNRIISKEEEREDPRRDSSIYLRVQWCFHILQELQVFPHAIQQVSSHPVQRKLFYIQNLFFHKKYYNYKAHPVQFSTRHLPVTAPMSPSILHGRIRLPASLQVFQGHTAQAGFQQFYPVETAF